MVLARRAGLVLLWKVKSGAGEKLVSLEIINGAHQRFSLECC